jgi:hypothetical protein
MARRIHTAQRVATRRSASLAAAAA